MSPLVNEWDAVTKNPAAPTAGFWFQVISAPPLIAAEVVIAETARSRPERSCNARQLHIDFVGAMLVKQHWGAGWQIRASGHDLCRSAGELRRANFLRFVVDYRRQDAVRVCAARDRDVAGHDLGHKSPFTTRINADSEAALGIPHSYSVQFSPVDGAVSGPDSGLFSPSESAPFSAQFMASAPRLKMTRYSLTCPRPPPRSRSRMPLATNWRIIV
jgi:hypothetical protein